MLVTSVASDLIVTGCNVQHHTKGLKLHLLTLSKETSAQCFLLHRW
jgi:hypothetical protein